MAGEHVLELPKFVWALKIVQTVLGVVLLALSAYQVSVVSWSGAGMTLFTALFSLIALTYFFVSLHAVQAAYNWIAHLVLESLSVVFWLVSWALHAAAVGGAFSYSGDYYYDYSWYYKTKRSLTKRYSAETFGNIIYTCLALALINWILYVVTLVFMALAVHRHRVTGVAATAPSSNAPAANNADEGAEMKVV